MKYRIEVSEEQLRVIGLAVDEYMRLRMGQFDDLAEDLAYDGIPRVKALTGKYTYDTDLQKRCSNIKNLFETAYKMAFPPHGYRGRQHDSWGTCIDLVHASSTSSGWTVRKTSGKSRAQQSVLSNLFRWGMSRSRKSRGWKNELPVL